MKKISLAEFIDEYKLDGDTDLMLKQIEANPLGFQASFLKLIKGFCELLDELASFEERRCAEILVALARITEIKTNKQDVLDCLEYVDHKDIQKFVEILEHNDFIDEHSSAEGDLIELNLDIPALSLLKDIVRIAGWECLKKWSQKSFDWFVKKEKRVKEKYAQRKERQKKRYYSEEKRKTRNW